MPSLSLSVENDDKRGPPHDDVILVDEDIKVCTESATAWANVLEAHWLDLKQFLNQWSTKLEMSVERAIAYNSGNMDREQFPKSACKVSNGVALSPLPSFSEHPPASLRAGIMASRSMEHKASMDSNKTTSCARSHSPTATTCTRTTSAVATKRNPSTASRRSRADHRRSILLGLEERQHSAFAERQISGGVTFKRKAGLAKTFGVFGSRDYTHNRKRFSSSRLNFTMGLITHMVASKSFEAVSAVVIMANAVCIGISSEYAMVNLYNPEHETLASLERGFLVFYIVELLLRIIAGGKSFWCRRDWQWNYFDLFLVFTSMYDQFIQDPVFEQQTPTAGQPRDDPGHTNSTISSAGKRLGWKRNVRIKLSHSRMFRLLKSLKLLRMIRLLKTFRELRLLVHAMLGSVKALVWSIVIIVAISYMFGVFFLQACTQYLQDSPRVPDQSIMAIKRYWGTVGKSMRTLYQVASNGVEWGVVGETLEEVGAPFYALFLVYIAFFMFVVMNTVTSLFIESTMSRSLKDNAMTIHMELAKMDAYIDCLQALFDEMDDDGNGEVALSEFTKHTGRPEMRAFAASLDIELADAHQFFFVLSESGKRTVDIETFVEGCIKLKGAARNIDLMDLLYSYRLTSNAMLDHLNSLDSRFDVLEGIIKDYRSKGCLHAGSPRLQRIEYF